MMFMFRCRLLDVLWIVAFVYACISYQSPAACLCIICDLIVLHCCANTRRVVWCVVKVFVTMHFGHRSSVRVITCCATGSCLMFVTMCVMMTASLFAPDPLVCCCLWCRISLFTWNLWAAMSSMPEFVALTHVYIVKSVLFAAEVFCASCATFCTSYNIYVCWWCSFLILLSTWFFVSYVLHILNA
jgi:hypothetical protein